MSIPALPLPALSGSDHRESGNPSSFHDKGICSKEHHIVESLLYSFDTAGFLRL